MSSLEKIILLCAKELTKISEDLEKSKPGKVKRFVTSTQAYPNCQMEREPPIYRCVLPKR